MPRTGPRFVAAVDDLRLAVAERRLRRRGRQHRLRAERPPAGAVERRWHHAFRGRLGSVLDGGRGRAACCRASLNPESGFITSSNNEIDRGASVMITRDWAAPFRATRLHRGAGTRRRACRLDAWRRCRTTPRAWRRRACSPASQQALEAAKAQGADDSAVRDADRAGRVGPRGRRAPGRDAVRSVRGRPLAAHVRRRDGRAALPRLLPMGRR